MTDHPNLPPDTCARCFDSGTLCSVCYREWLKEERREEDARIVMICWCFLIVFVAAIFAVALFI